MTAEITAKSAHEFTNGILKRILEARTARAAVSEFPRIFERGVSLIYNGERLDLAWLETHVYELFKRLRHIRVEVTHAGREGKQLCERHVVSAISAENGERWEIEVMAVYELNDTDQIRSWRELSRIVHGRYSGW
jgi:hypothetical protein